MMQWKMDPPHCFVEFAVRHWGVAWVRGRFSTITGMVLFDEDTPEQGSAVVEIETDSISTGNEMRDGHLRSKDFFDVKAFPKATFKSTAVKKKGEDTYVIEGVLEIRGIVKPIELTMNYAKPHEVPALSGVGTEVRAGFSGKATINRHDFGLNWDTPGLPGKESMVGGEVDLIIGAEVVKQ